MSDMFTNEGRQIRPISEYTKELGCSLVDANNPRVDIWVSNREGVIYRWPDCWIDDGAAYFSHFDGPERVIDCITGVVFGWTQIPSARQ